MTEVVLRQDEGGVATLILNRPEALNALNADVFARLHSLAVELARQTETVGCVVLRGAGKAFSAGLDLREVAAAPITEESHAFRALTISALAALPQPVIAAVHGICFTGALELALAADLMIVADTARFKDTHARLGFTPLWGMSQRLPRRIGIAAAAEIMFTGREFSGAEAYEIGLANRCVPAAEFDDAVAAYAREVVQHSWPSLVHQKRLMREGAAMSLEAALAYERKTSPGAVADSEERVRKIAK